MSSQELFEEMIEENALRFDYETEYEKEYSDFRCDYSHYEEGDGNWC